jgi:hypothetical protein
VRVPFLAVAVLMLLFLGAAVGGTDATRDVGALAGP